MKLQFSIRTLIVLAIVVSILIAGWQFLNRGLYSDNFVERFAQDRIGTSRFATDVLGQPCLDVVPSGQTKTRHEVFETLGIQESRLENFRQVESGKVTFLIWQISPAYELNCMTGTKGRENAMLALDDPDRKVYGIRIVEPED